MPRPSRILRDLLALACLGGLLTAISAAPAAAAKCVIFHQWGGAPVADVLRNQVRLESMPFDGTTVTIPASSRLMLAGPMSAEDMRQGLAPLKGAFSRFRHNFVVVHTRRPPDVFDDWMTEIADWRNLARAARAAGLAGIFYDNEEYKEKTFKYPRDVKYPQRGRDEYHAQWRLRGRQVMQAMVTAFPNIVVLTFHGPYISDPRTPDAVTRSQAGARAEDLRGSFFVGMVEGAGPRATVVDGGECYQYRSAADFETSYQWRKYGLARGPSPVLPASLRGTYASKVSIAFATYNKQWLSRYPMDPSVMRTTLANAIRRSDRYVWVYIEGDWVKSGAPADWLSAIRDGVAAGKGGTAARRTSPGRPTVAKQPAKQPARQQAKQKSPAAKDPMQALLDELKAQLGSKVGVEVDRLRELAPQLR